jgi:cell division protein FtsQ
VDRKKTIKKIMVLSAWSAVFLGLATLLVAASQRESGHTCSQVQIGIRGTGEKFYIEESDILKQIEMAAGGPVVNRPLSKIDLGKLEELIESNAWIRSAELYVDNRDVLHVTVSEREPVARVFTRNGTSFYIDSAAMRMPLLDKLTARVPVVTGFTSAKRLNAADSALLLDVRNVALYIYQHPFWNAQVGQVDITANGAMELIPVIGNHVVRLGRSDRLEDKLNNLFVFYRQVMSKTGFDRYAVLDLQFEGQVVAVHKGPSSPVDSLQLKQNIEQLLNANIEAEANKPLPVTDKPAVPAEQVPVKATPTVPVNEIPVKTNPNPSNSSNPPKRTTSETPEKSFNGKTQPPKPKAVMPKRENR